VGRTAVGILLKSANEGYRKRGNGYSMAGSECTLIVSVCCKVI
jgi:hypothetical protein